MVIRHKGQLQRILTTHTGCCWLGEAAPELIEACQWDIQPWLTSIHGYTHSTLPSSTTTRPQTPQPPSQPPPPALHHHIGAAAHTAQAIIHDRKALPTKRLARPTPRYNAPKQPTLLNSPGVSPNTL